MFRHFCVLFLVACTLWTAVAMLFLVACSNNGDSGGNNERDGGSAELVLGRLQVPLFDSISIFVSAEDMENIQISANSISDNIKVDGIPLGENRKFEVKVYADKGKLVLKGEANTDIAANQNTKIHISLTALYGFLRLEIPLGLANSENIHSGTLTLDSLRFQMQIENGKGIFNTGALPLNQTFNMRIELKGQNDNILFFGAKEIKLSSIQQTETMQLKSTIGTAILELEASSIEPLQILAVLPKARSRPPENYGDLFFTEFFAAPTSGGSHFEYMEIYNATLDTLELFGCRIARDRTTIAKTYRFNMPENLILPPMEFLFLGRDSIKNADFNYQDFTFDNNKQSLGFFCNNLVIDSLYYSNNEDNPFPMKSGSATQLPLSNFKNRDRGSSWCLGSSPKQDAEC